MVSRLRQKQDLEFWNTHMSDEDIFYLKAVEEKLKKKFEKEKKRKNLYRII